MGNRAVITIAPYAEENLGIYVHWNGGQESIEGFMRAAKALGYRTPGDDPAYGMARLVQAIGLFFGGTTSIGIGRNDELATDDDNGTWLIGPGWEIVGRQHGAPPVPLTPEGEIKANAICASIVAKTEAAEAVKAKEA